MNAKFEADSTFTILGRGLVLAGWVIGGRVRPGMSISIPAFPQRLVIQGIEHLAVDPKAALRPGLIGLRFPLFGEAESTLWKQLDVQGKVFELVEDLR